MMIWGDGLRLDLPQTLWSSLQSHIPPGRGTAQHVFVQVRPTTIFDPKILPHVPSCVFETCDTLPTLGDVHA